jgi:phospholipase C
VNAAITLCRRPLAAISAVAALALAWAVPGSAATAQAKTPIRHVVVIYLENHSFDNLLGFWCHGYPGRCPDGGMPSTVTLSTGTVVTPSTAPDVVPIVQHNTHDQVEAIDGGKMDGRQKIPGCTATQNYTCISGYHLSQVPNLAVLARDFAISDRTFSMQDSPSWFGHLYAVAASTDGFTGSNPPVSHTPGYRWGCDSGKNATWVNGGVIRTEPSCIPDPALTGPGGLPLANGGAYAPTPVRYVPTILDRLGAAGLAWRIYGATCGTETVNAQGLDTCTSAPGGYLWSICPSFAECPYKQSSGLVPARQFTVDASHGNLPTFSVVTPPTGTTSWHNGFSITAGDDWLGSLVSAAMNGPEWRSTAIFITWDDCGCFYDQVRPGTNPDGTPQGPRVPLVIVSPYAKWSRP